MIETVRGLVTSGNNVSSMQPIFKRSLIPDKMKSVLVDEDLLFERTVDGGNTENDIIY